MKKGAEEQTDAKKSVKRSFHFKSLERAESSRCVGGVLLLRASCGFDSRWGCQKKARESVLFSMKSPPRGLMKE